jgi:hypothetical protein
MISDLRHDEHPVCLVAPEIRRVIEVSIREPGVRTITVLERVYEVGGDFGLRRQNTATGLSCRRISPPGAKRLRRELD